MVDQAAGGDTLDRVILFVNAINVYDSLPGLGLTQGQTLVATPAGPFLVVPGDLLTLQAFKVGVAAPMVLRGKVRVF